MSVNPSWTDANLPPLTPALVSEPPISPLPAAPAVPAVPFAAPEPAPAPEPAHPVLPPAAAEPEPTPAPALLPPVVPRAPEAAPSIAAVPPEPAPVAPPAAEPAQSLAPVATPDPPAVPVTTYRILVRVDNGEQIEVAAHADGAAARSEATTLMRYLRDGRGDWPFVGGRFIRPDRIVSVDVEETHF